MAAREKSVRTPRRADEPEAPQYKFKVVVVGDSGVGKTSLIRRFVFGTFDPRRTKSLETEITTHGAFLDLSYLGLTLSRRRDPFPVDTARGGMHVDLLIWDILGQRKGRRRKNENPYEGAKGVVAVADLTRKATLESLDTWIEDVYDVAGTIPTVLLANKLDLLPKAELQEADVARAAWAFDSPYILASAKTGFNVDSGFEGLAKTIYLDILAKKLE